MRWTLPTWIVERWKRTMSAWNGKEHGVNGGTVKHLRAGETLRTTHDTKNFVYLLLSGCCELKGRSSSGQQAVATFVPGDAITEINGHSALLEQDATIRVTADSVVLRMPREEFRRLLDERRTVSNPLRSARPGKIIPFGRGGRKGRVLCITSLTEEFPAGHGMEYLARTIGEETSRPALWLRINGSPDAAPLEQWQSQRPNERGGLFHLELRTSDSPKALPALQALLDRQAEQFAYVLVDVGRHAPMEVLLECIRQSRATYLFLRQKPDNLFEFNLLSREAKARELELGLIKPIVYLESAESAHGLSRYVEETTSARVHSYLRADGEKWKISLRRLAREICDRRVGLALSSGAARGLAHIGVIQILEENGIEVDAVAGSSMGAYVTAVWGKGYSGLEMERFARELEGYRGMWRFMDLSIPPNRGFLGTGRVRKRLEKTIGAAHFSDMARPIRLVATRLDTLERIVFSGGNVVDAVLASIAIPGVCVPVTLDGVTYIDGGLCDPLPVDALLDMGIRKIIAVNTIATPETLKACRLETDCTAENVQPRVPWTNRWNVFASGNVFDILMRSMHAAQTRLAEASCRRASVVLRPYSCQGRWNEFGNPAAFIALGRQTTEAHLPEIQALFAPPSYEDKPRQHLVAHAS